MKVTRLNCFACGHALALQTPIFRTTTCPECDADMKVCKNCRFYDVNASKSCREPVSEPVRDKERANFCDFFRPAAPAGGQPGERSEADEARARLEALFKS
ncbi:hypothetical protein DL240_08990 [Lujinxingia litoralis]|uniref:Uncharacterized protein n=1 Tax=Lujinxingia litoralis TaxID=2211119 RepID=A0A328CB62_9DELT|nr:hypothetical protein [Lujinxingia litoralis]RAL23013.1 hypothetical protein DL240_08990 [Lujinxingia litoralis]